MQKTKILCTIGPASWDKSVIEQMVANGMNIARINGAFADTAELKRVADLIRSVSKDVSLMLDIKGSELRLNKFATAINIKPGDEVVIGSGPEDAIYVITYPDLYKDVRVGVNILGDDGKIKLEVTKIENKKIYTKVITGSQILPAKGLNVPSVELHNPTITPRDIEQINFAIKVNWDMIAGSFIRRADDIDVIRKQCHGSLISIYAKVENEEGVEKIEEIIDAADGIIVARGDLGVELPFERIPMIQKEIVAKCLLKAKPAIVATHMLESMINEPNATRAEINDVANSVFDGADTVWLSAETSKGKYPVLAVQTLRKIADEAEKHILPEILDTDKKVNPITVALAKGIINICENLPIKKIIVLTDTGRTARILSSYKPRQDIIALTSNELYKQMLNTSWGVKAITYKTATYDRDKCIKSIVKKVLDEKLVNPEDLIIVIRGTSKESGQSNSLEIGLAKEIAA